MKNASEVTKALADAFEKLQADEIDVSKADALANIAGKLIKNELGRLTYHEQRKTTPALKWWDDVE